MMVCVLVVKARDQSGRPILQEVHDRICFDTLRETITLGVHAIKNNKENASTDDCNE